MPGKLQKSDPKVTYMGPDQGPFMCRRCEYFQPPSSCEKVSGTIYPMGCCNLFQKDEDAAPMPMHRESRG